MPSSHCPTCEYPADGTICPECGSRIRRIDDRYLLRYIPSVYARRLKTVVFGILIIPILLTIAPVFIILFISLGAAVGDNAIATRAITTTSIACILLWMAFNMLCLMLSSRIFLPRDLARKSLRQMIVIVTLFNMTSTIAALIWRDASFVTWIIAGTVIGSVPLLWVILTALTVVWSRTRCSRQDVNRRYQQLVRMLRISVFVIVVVFTFYVATPRIEPGMMPRIGPAIMRILLSSSAAASCIAAFTTWLLLGWRLRSAINSELRLRMPGSVISERIGG